MTYSQGKISLRQALLLVMSSIYSPAVRLFPNFTATHAKQAGWLAPVVSFIVFIPVIYMLYAFAKKYKDESFIGIMDDICGRIPGKIILFFYIIWLAILTALYLRYYSERLLTTILPHASNFLFILIMTATVAVTLRKSVVVLARMNEILSPFLLLVYIGCIIFSLPEFRFKFLLPISRLDIVPMLGANFGILGIWGYLPLIFLFGENIKNKRQIKKQGIQAMVFTAIMSVLFIAVCIGVLDSSLIEILPIPFFVVVRQISLFDTIERIESLIVSLWVVTDFVLVAMFITIAMDMLKGMFKLSDTKHIISIYSLIMLFLSLILCKSLFELESFSGLFYIYVNVVFTLAIPAFVFIIGKIRKKV